MEMCTFQKVKQVGEIQKKTEQFVQLIGGIINRCFAGVFEQNVDNNIDIFFHHFTSRSDKDTVNAH